VSFHFVVVCKFGIAVSEEHIKGRADPLGKWVGCVSVLLNMLPVTKIM
jgi:hypothetical protein